MPSIAVPPASAVPRAPRGLASASTNSTCEPIVKTAMRIPVTLRARLKAQAALQVLSLNALYLQVLSAFLKRDRSTPIEWLRPQALRNKTGNWCQAPLHLPAALETALASEAANANVSLATVYYTAMSHYAHEANLR